MMMFAFVFLYLVKYQDNEQTINGSYPDFLWIINIALYINCTLFVAAYMQQQITGIWMMAKPVVSSSLCS